MFVNSIEEDASSSSSSSSVSVNSAEDEDEEEEEISIISVVVGEGDFFRRVGEGRDAGICRDEGFGGE